MLPTTQFTLIKLHMQHLMEIKM